MIARKLEMPNLTLEDVILAALLHDIGKLRVDLTDKSAGVHTVDVVIKSEKYNNVWQIGTYSTAVTIK